MMEEVIYKGATRPPIKWGVPLLALVLVFMPTIVVAVWASVLISLWIAPFVLAVLGPLYGWMRYVTYADDQRLLQMILRLKLARLTPNSRLWKARSYSVHRPRGKSRVCI